jgi:DNA-directed RNA polymerase specialized sigma24 family protein
MALARIHNIIDLSRSEVERLITEYCFVAKEREVLYSRWLDGLTFEEISEKHAISERQAKTIVRKNRERVLSHIDRLKLH